MLCVYEYSVSPEDEDAFGLTRITSRGKLNKAIDYNYKYNNKSNIKVIIIWLLQ